MLACINGRQPRPEPTLPATLRPEPEPRPDTQVFAQEIRDLQRDFRKLAQRQVLHEERQMSMEQYKLHTEEWQSLMQKHLSSLREQLSRDVSTKRAFEEEDAQRQKRQDAKWVAFEREMETLRQAITKAETSTRADVERPTAAPYSPGSLDVPQIDAPWRGDSFNSFRTNAEAHSKRISQKRIEGLDPWQKLVETHLAAHTQEVMLLRGRQDDILWRIKTIEQNQQCNEAEPAAFKEFSGGDANKLHVPPVAINGNALAADAWEKPTSRQYAHYKAQAGEPHQVTQDFIDESLAEEYSFLGSIWDASIFIGTTPMGRSGSFLLVLCLLLEAVMSVIFIYATYDPDFLGGYEDDTIVRLKDWRVNSGHAHHYISEDHGHAISLVSRVCNRDESLEFSMDKVHMLNDISSYIGIGKYLTVLGVLVWWLVVLKDLNNIWTFAIAVFPIERQPHTKIIFHEGVLRILCLSFPRYAATLVMLLFRFCSTAALVIAGTMFLMNTLDVAGIILNTISLDVILSLDELLYLSLAPAHAKAFLNRLEPLSANQPRIHGVDVWFLLYPCMTVAIIMIMFYAVADTVERLESYESALCGGAKHFAYARDRGGMVKWVETIEPKLPGESGWDGTRDFASFAVWQIIDQKYSLRTMEINVEEGEEFAWSPGEANLRSFERWLSSDKSLTETEWLHSVYFDSKPETATYECRDLRLYWTDNAGYSCEEYEARGMCSSRQNRDPATRNCCTCGGGLRRATGDMLRGSRFPTKILLFLQTLSPTRTPPGGFAGVEQCSDFAQYCRQIPNYPAMIARAFCPDTCGCAHVTDGVWNFEGCHEDAVLHYNRKVSERKWDNACTDESLETMSSWVTYLAWTFRDTFSVASIAKLRSKGCAGIPELEDAERQMACSVDFSTQKPFMPVCPIACGCQSNPFDPCPRSCTASNSKVVLSGFGWDGREVSRVIEVYVTEDVENMSQYSLGVPAQAREDVQEFWFNPGPVKQGTFIYIARKKDSQVADVFPNIRLDYQTQSWVKYNGNDNIVLFHNNSVVDRYGEELKDGTGLKWEYGADRPYDVISRRPGLRPNWFFSRDEWTRERMEVFGSFQT